MEMAAMARPAGTGDDGSVSTAAPYGTVIPWLVWTILLALLTVAAVLSQVVTPAGAVDQLSVTGSPDAGGIEKALTSTADAHAALQNIEWSPPGWGDYLARFERK